MQVLPGIYSTSARATDERKCCETRTSPNSVNLSGVYITMGPMENLNCVCLPLAAVVLHKRDEHTLGEH